MKLRLLDLTFIGIICLVASSLASRATAQTITQSLPLHAGWNAVYLEVEPMDSAPEVVFAGLPIHVVAHYFPQSSSVQFISDPADAPWNEPGWGVWYARERPDAFLTSLHAISGRKAYLVHSTEDFVWEISGTASFGRMKWQADSFNLTGFAVDEAAPPTFGEFFSGAGGKIGQRVYRLGVDGKWAPVTAPGSARMRSGEACWVYCSGRTGYQGPLDVNVSGLGGLEFGELGATLEINLRNNLSELTDVSITSVPQGGDLPVVRVTRDLSTLRTVYADLQAPTEPVALEAGEVASIRLGVRREAMTAPEQTRLLKLSSSFGVRFWIPLHAERPDLAAQP